jgi:hypothetical protein
MTCIRFNVQNIIAFRSFRFSFENVHRLPLLKLSSITDAPSYMQHRLKTLKFLRSFFKFSTTFFGLHDHHQVLKRS